MYILNKSVLVLAKASDGNPIITTIVVYLFFLLFTMAEQCIEKLIFGERFEHWLDPIFIGFFIAYSAYAVYGCALYKTAQENGIIK